MSDTAGLAIGLALSGGGVRAMAFHSGVLRRLAETKRLEDVAHVSSVSGGTLAMGLVLEVNGGTWPTSKQYLEVVWPKFRRTLIDKNLGLTALLLLARPSNWRFALSRANVLSQAIQRCWGVSQSLADLPAQPVWSINGTTAETGRRFRFKQDRCGDYEIGYADASKFRLADAMAVSAAFPGLVGPLSIRTSHYEWKRRPYWDAPAGSEVPVTLPYRRLHLYDGGIYDNLALEPLMDPGSQRFKNGIGYLVCSDAGAPLKRTATSIFGVYRALRLLDIVMDQTRSLRVRPLASFLAKNPMYGAYAQIGAAPAERIRQYGSHNLARAQELLRREWLPAEEVTQAANHSTSLWPLTDPQFARLDRHGYESLQWQEELFKAFSGV